MIPPEPPPITQHIALADGGRLLYTPGWLGEAAAARLFSELTENTPWAQQAIAIAGRQVLQPRLTAWVGDPHAVYTYSGLRNVPLPWPEALEALRTRLSSELEVPFNSVLLNLYRDGRDSMGNHADNERELGVNPVIASLSLGGTRRFVLAHRRDPNARLKLELEHGSLLVMAGSTQHHYKHGLPRQAGAGPRINLTFRRILTGKAR